MKRNKRREEMPYLSKRRINFEMTPSKYSEMKKLMNEKGIKQSHFIRKALEEYIKKIKREKLEEELKEGYLTKAELNRKICKEFKHADGENI